MVYFYLVSKNYLYLFLKVNHKYLILIFVVYTFTDKRSDYLNCPQKVREQFAVFGILGRGTFGEVRLAFEKVSFIKLNVLIFYHLDQTIGNIMYITSTL